MVKRFFMKFYLVLIIAFLYIPIAVLVVLSFNASRSRVVWGGFTLKWYQILLHNSDVVAALQNTLTIGFASAAIATGIGLLAAIGIECHEETKLFPDTWNRKHSVLNCRYRDRSLLSSGFPDLQVWVMSASCWHM